jgi:hypothetical protein
VSNNALRGTTALRRPAGLGHSYYLRSDYRKKVFVGVNTFNFWGFNKAVRGNNVNLDFNYQPLDALRISLSAGYSYTFRRQDQFVSTIRHNNEMRTIVGEVKQKTIRFTGRANYNITPDLTLQYYGQPFITRPLFDRFGYVSSPMAKKYDDRFIVFAPGQISGNNGQFSVDENRDGVPDFTFDKPDFNFVQFRSNLILRWEYKAGSEFYLVWSQGNTPDASADLDRPLLPTLFDNAFRDGGRNIFLVKMTYRFLK